MVTICRRNFTLFICLAVAKMDTDYLYIFSKHVGGLGIKECRLSAWLRREGGQNPSVNDYAPLDKIISTDYTTILGNLLKT